MRIGISVKMRVGGYDRFGDEKYNKIKSYGFDCVDFDMCNTNHMLYNLSARRFEEYLESEKRLAQKAGIEIFQTHGPWPIRDTEQTAILEKMEKSIRATSLLGSKYWVIHPLMPYGIADIKSGHAEETWKANLSFITELLVIAKKHDVIICLENTPFPDFSLASPQQIHKLVNSINDNNLKMCLDTGHVAVLGSSSIGDIIRHSAEEIKVLHVHDNGGVADDHLPPYMGVIDWQVFSAALKEIGFCGVLSLEIVPKESLPTDEFERQSITLAEIASRLSK